ncbi:S-crystallin SL11 [Holothuria leucospilota]|uniref:S-crystallin SL11 n=1 Tax=Holothuria leucospilota TaxID=206669 RepID=A0A9Q1BDC5_HOLLE|nr:S-crystallin SL11 [Holothuria leucospilota]
MPSYKLVYFNLRVQAEPIRYMFHLAGVDFEDKRVTEDEWKEFKSKPGLGQLPILEVDGKELPQSGAIYRYVAREHGFYPSSSWDRAKVDVVIETVGDFDPEMRKFFSERDPAKKTEVIKHFEEEGSVKHANNMEKLLKENNGGTGWFVGDKITLADVIVFYMWYDLVPSLLGIEPGTFDLKENKLLESFIKRFQSEPSISEWLEKRPQTPF